MYNHRQLTCAIVGLAIMASYVRHVIEMRQTCFRFKPEQLFWLAGPGPTSMANPHGLGLYHWSAIATWETFTILAEDCEDLLFDLHSAAESALALLMESSPSSAPPECQEAHLLTLNTFCTLLGVRTWGEVANTSYQPTTGAA